MGSGFLAYWFLMVLLIVIAFVCVTGESKLRDRGPLMSFDRQVCWWRVPKRCEWAVRGVSVGRLGTTADSCFLCTYMSHLTTGMRSEKCVVRRFRRCANVYLHKPREYSMLHS